MKQHIQLKKILSMGLSVVMVAGSIMITKPQELEAAGNNLVGNGGFDTTTDWYDTTLSDDGTQIAVQESIQKTKPEYILYADFASSANADKTSATQSTEALRDSNVEGATRVWDSTGSLKVTGTGKNQGVRTWHQKVSLNTEYTFTVKVKNNTVGSAVRFVVSEFNSARDAQVGNDHVFSESEITTVSDEWITKQMTYTFTNEETAYAVFWVKQPNEVSNFTYYIDEISLSYEVGATKEEVVDILPLDNYDDFNTGGGDTLRVAGSSTLSHDSADDNSYVQVKGTASEQGVRTQLLKVQTGKKHRFAFRLKNDTEGAKIKFKVMEYDSSTQDQGTYTFEDEFSTTGAWENVTLEYTITNETTAKICFYIYQANSLGDFNFGVDDLRISHIDEVPDYTYSEGIGTCEGGEGDNNVLAMKEMTEATYKNIVLEAGEIYGYSYKIKTDNVASVTFSAGEQAVETSVATKEWTTVSGAFKASSAAETISFARSGEGTLLIDDVKVYVTGQTLNNTVQCNLDNGLYIVTEADTVTIDGNTYQRNAEYAEVGVHTLVYEQDGVEYRKTLVLYYMGDSNTDSKVNVKDLIRCKKYLYSPQETLLDEAGLLATDMNGDKSLNQADAKMMREELVANK